MSNLSEELLRLWDSDPDAGYEGDSPFTVWWEDTIRKSIDSSRDESYRGCLLALLEGSRLTILATQYNSNLAPGALAYMMRALEFFQAIDPRLLPTDPNVFDLEDVDQAVLLMVYQYDAVIGSADFTAALDQWFTRELANLDVLVNQFATGAQGESNFKDDGYDPLDALDEMVWASGMLEWLKLDDPRRNLGINLSEYQLRISNLEQQMRPALRNLREGGAAWPDKGAPARFWWRH